MRRDRLSNGTGAVAEPDGAGAIAEPDVGLIMFA